jgi:DNA primase
MQDALDKEEVPVPDAMGMIRFERRLNADISIVRLPEGKDPDELIRKTPERWTEIVETAQPFLAFYIDAVSAEAADGDPRAKSAVVARVTPLLRQLPDRVIQAHYVDRLATKLRLDPRLVQAEVRQGASLAQRGPAATRPGAPAYRRHSTEDHLIALLLQHRTLCADIIGAMTPDELGDSRNQALFLVISDPDIPDLDAEQILAGIDDALADHAEALLEGLTDKPRLLPGAVRKEAEAARYRIQLDRIQFLEREVAADLREAQLSGDTDSAEQLIARLDELGARKRRLPPPPSPYFRDTRNAEVTPGRRPPH